MKFTSVLAVLAVIIGFASCDNESGFKTTDSGLKYKFYEDVDGETADYGDWVTIKMEYGKEDSVIFSTSMAEGGTSTFPLQEPQFEGDIYEAIAMMSPGDSGVFVVSADSFFLVTARSRELPPFIDEGSDLYFNIKLEDVQSAEEHQAAEEERLGKLREEDEVRLQEYVEENDLSGNLTPEGIYFISEKKGNGPRVDTGAMVKLHLAIESLGGEKIYSSKQMGQPATYEFGKQFDTEGLDYAVAKMREGGEAVAIIPSEYAWGAEGRGQMLPPFTSLRYEIEIVDVMDKETYERQQAEERKKREAEMKRIAEERQAAEPQKIRDYIQQNNIDVQPTESGLYFIPVEEGTGESPIAGDNVKVHYTLYTLDGTKLQSSKDAGDAFTFTLGQGEVIKGWDEGIPMMKEGGTARLLVPSSLAYGERSMGGGIEAYTPLLFEVELLEVNPEE